MKNYAITDQLTREEFDSWMIVPSYLSQEEADVSAGYFGKQYSSPIMISTLSGMGNVFQGGNRTLARAAALTGTLDWNGVMSAEDGLAILEDGVEAVLSSKPLGDHERIMEMMKLYAENGARAFVIDVDFIFDNEAGGFRKHPLFGEMGRMTGEDLKEMAGCCDLPLIIKGVLSVQDAQVCREAGVKGIVVSHHMGMLETAVPPLRMMRQLKETVGEDVLVFADCGIRSGADAFKALALGADGVLVGRPVMEAFRKGPEAAADLLNSYTAQLKYCMSVTGSADIRHINAEALIRR